MKVDIIGAGLGGLTLGVALQKNGINATVYERAPQFNTVGAGILMASNAMQIAKKLGFSEAIRVQGNPLEQFGLANQNGDLLMTTNMKTIHEKYGESSVAIHRANLHQILVEKMKENSVKTGKVFQKFEQLPNGKVKTYFEDGTISEADLLIGADGIKSKVRFQLFDREMPLRYATHTCWRGVVEGKLDQPAKTAELWAREGGKRVAMIQLNDHQIYFYFTLKKPVKTVVPTNETHDFLKKELSVFPPVYSEKILNIKPENVRQDDLFDLVPLPHWSARNVGLIGDAAHATSPNLGQGGCQAMEDGFYLAELLKNAPPQYPTDFQPILKQFEAFRRPKIKFVVDTSYRLGLLSNFGGAIGSRIRDFISAATPNSVSVAQFDRLFRLENIR